MARKKINNYAVFQNTDGKVSINVYYETGGADTIKDLSVKESKYITNLLRNEKPMSYDHSRKRLSNWSVEQVGEAEGGYLEPLFTLDRWINKRTYIRDFINFELPNGAVHNYKNWTTSEKKELSNYYNKVLRNRNTGVFETPQLTTIPSGNATVSTNMNRSTAWNYYLAFIAQSLVVEADMRVRWTVKDLNDEGKQLIFDSRNLFRWSSGNNAYNIPFSLGVVSPGDPFKIYTFLQSNNLIGSTHLKTVTRLIDWCRQLVHFSGGWDADNVFNQWQYKGFPPIERVINGTIRMSTPDQGVKKRTGGCWGTTGFLRMCLRTLNIPVKLETRANHALPSFISIKKYLTHGDDPYNRMFGVETEIPASRLLINQSTWNTWFGAGADHIDNIGRQVRVLALEFLPLYILKKHCEDKAANKNHADSSVFEIFKKNYTVNQLEAMNLWQRMDAKISALGGCNAIP
jgi:hypothetical protein